MKTPFLKGLIFLFTILLAQTACAVNIVQVYQQALENDPTYKAALAKQKTIEEQIPQARSLLLPQLSFGGSGTLSKTRTRGDGVYETTPKETRARSYSYELKLTQNIFNFSYWKGWSTAKNNTKAASATYNAAALDLIKRIALAYFNILQAQDVLQFTIAAKRAFHQEYVRAYQQFKVGVNTITDVYNAKAAYDKSVADYVTAKNTLANTQEDLRAITGILYKNVETLRDNFPLINPMPNNINQWVDTAIRQNWSLIAARFVTQAAQENIQAARGRHLPTLDFTAKYDSMYTRGLHMQPDAYSKLNNRSRTNNPSAELDLTIPLYSGGKVNSQVREAIANYQLKSNEQEKMNRQVVNDTRKAFLGVISGISKVTADKQSLKSYESSLRGMQEGYKVGTRTMVDVLNAQTSLYEAQITYAKDRYQYILNTIELKEGAGTLSETDLQIINKWITPSLTKKTKAVSPSIKKKPGAKKK